MLADNARSRLGLCLLSVLLACDGDTAPAAEKEGNQAAARRDRFADPLPPGALVRLGTTRFRPGGSVRAAALAPDGKTLASATDRDVSLWDLATGRRLRRCDGDSDGVLLAFADKGRSLVAVDSEGTVHFLDVATGKEIRRLQIAKQFNRHPLESALTPDGRFLAFREEDEVRVWDLPQGKEVSRFRILVKAGPLDLSPDGTTLASLGDRVHILLWDVAGGKQKAAWPHEGGDLGLLRFSPDGKTLISAGTTLAISSWEFDSHRARSWDVATGKEKHRFGKEDNWNIAIGFSADSKLLATTNPDDTLRVWDLATGKEQRRWPLGEAGWRHETDSLIFTPDARTLITAGDGDDVIRLWDVSAGKEISPLSGPQQRAYALTASPDGKLLAATCCFARKSRLWLLDAKSGAELFQWPAGRCVPAAFTPDGKHLAYAPDDYTIRLCAVSSGKEAVRFQGHTNDVGALTFSQDGKTLFTTARDESLRSWEVASGKELRRHTLEKPTSLFHTEGIRYDYFSPDGQRLLTGDSSKEGHSHWLFSVSTGRRFVSWSQRSEKLRTVAIAPDGRTFAGVGPGDTLELSETATGTKRLSLQSARKDRGYLGWRPVAFAPDGRLLAANSHDDRAVDLYDVATGKLVGNLETQQGGITALAFVGNGDVLAVAGRDTTILLWDMAEVRRQARLQSVVLSDEDCSKLWEQLGTDSVHQSIWKLSAGTTTVRFLQKRLRPVVGPSAQQVAQWLTELNDNSFTVREKAMRNLRNAGELVEPALREYLKKDPPLEGARRVEQLLKALENQEGILTAEQVRQARALEVLENMGTDEAWKLVAELAGGASRAWLTREAQVTLNRLHYRSPGGPAGR
jgi:WD40 repeat protein